MNIEEFREYCLSKPMVTEETPFGVDTLVFKVYGKVFALCSIAEFSRGVNLKCDPETAVELRERYLQVKPGYHMNKKHWNTVLTEAGLPIGLMEYFIDESYRLVTAKLPSAQRKTLNI